MRETRRRGLLELTPDRIGRQDDWQAIGKLTIQTGNGTVAVDEVLVLQVMKQEIRGFLSIDIINSVYRKEISR